MPTIRRIEIDVSSDIANKVISFLENLPKSKVKIYYKNNSDKNILLETSGLLKNRGIDPIKWQEEIRSEWDGR